LAGRGSVVKSANGGESVAEYNNLGQLVKSTDADGVSSLFEYDGRGQQTVTALDVDGNGQIGYGGSDRISRTRRFVTTRAGAGTVSRTETERWMRDGANAPVVVSQSDTSVTGDQSWTTSGTQTSHQQIIYGAPSDWTVTSTQPDGSKQIQTYTGGRLVSSVLQDSGGGQLGGTTYTYDAHGRVASTTDARNGTSSVTYYTTDEVASTTTPAPGGGGGAQTTSIVYDAAGRQDIVTLPDGGQVDYDYYPTGSLQKVSGARTYTVQYAYDAQGRLTTQTTNPGAAEQQTTTWAYEPGTGRLANKTLPGGSSTSYTYTTGGRTATRTNARGIVTTYTHNPAGDITGISYSDATPGITFAQERNGQATSVSHNGSTHSYAYNDFGQVTQESVAGGTLAGASLAHNYDALRRRTGLTAATGAANISQSFAYDPLVSRLKTASQGDRSATYHYVANSALINTIEHKTGGALKMTETRVYDQLNRLSSISAASSAASNALNRATAYTYNSANQRTMADQQDGSYWTYTYDGFGHVTSADRHLPNGELMAGRQFDYAYGGLGNRQSAAFGGDAAGGSMQTISYTAGAGDRNQYASIANPGVVVTTGEANAAAAITVDTNAAIRQGDWFAYQSSVDNSAGAVFASLDIEAIEGANTDNITRKQLVPAASLTPTYDADGNLTFDGYQDFTWDAENRLTSIEVRDALVPAGAPKYRIEFSYDYSGRRIATRLYGGGAGNWTLANETKYIYDGWNVIAEFSGTGLISKSYLWGLDLSGSLQGAGGVGGLLSMEQHLGGGASRHYVAYDGNGNVVGLADADSGEMSALYEYSAFGEVLQMEGVYAVKNSYRFSTKPQEGMTGLYYYGYRFYDAGAGRFINRDPIGEEGGVNLYGFVENDGVNRVDVLGLFFPNY
jgi:RHS repeat-associated protein